jgi:nitronate monooxygenase
VQRLHELFGIELPIVQAPMAGSQGSALAIAVCAAGGLGSLPCALLCIETVRSEIAAIRAATRAPFNLNFFCHPSVVADPVRELAWRQALRPYFDELGLDWQAVPDGIARTPFGPAQTALVEDLRPAVVSFHFGLPGEELLHRVRAAGAKIISSATTVAEAQWLEARGVDAVIAQGIEAGGHRGMFLSEDLGAQSESLALLAQIGAAVSLPVIAAGGIADARGVAAALSIGAVAAQVGTAYLLCTEATTSPVHRAALQSANAAQTAVTNVFTGRPARGICNRLMREIGPISALAPTFPHAAQAIAPLRAQAEAAGRGDFSPLWAGGNISGCRDISARELTLTLAGRSAT